MINSETFILLILLILGGIGVLSYILLRQIKNIKNDLKGNEDTILTQWLKEMRETVERKGETQEKQLTEMRKTLDEQLKSQRDAMGQQTKVLWERLENATNVIGKVQEHLGGINELGKDMKDLNNILKSPKLRGGLGEQFLYEILETSLPKDLYRTQYAFKNGAICDAVIFTDKGIIPVDSKFPMENFKNMISAKEEEKENYKKAFLRDVKKRIDEVAGKYILPEEGTTDQAVMYIPSENVFYELIVHSTKVEEYARRKNVLMTSPNTFSFFVKTILVAYQQHEIEKNAKEILKSLGGIKVEAEKFGGDLETLSKHILNSYKNMEKVNSSFADLFGRIERVQSIGENVEQPKITEKPLLEKLED
ncbi:DNA recombination protein RmuC [Patescibacteria group bacterium]|nr:DNA recombination protein RmuC [Patescibacteria group bacterium]HOM77861.1 DNA recombination protein RmuC [bacterium]